MKKEEYNVIADYMHGMAQANILISPALSHAMHQVAEQVRNFSTSMPSEGICPYCRAKYLIGHYLPEKRGTEEIIGFTMRVIKWLCKKDEQYWAGYRAIWKCDHCGEMEIR